jgi:hypothetical protein
MAGQVSLQANLMSVRVMVVDWHESSQLLEIQVPNYLSAPFSQFPRASSPVA